MSDKKGHVSSKRSLGEKYSDLDKKFKVLTVFGIIFCIVGLPMIIWGGIWAYNSYAIGGEVTPEETPITKLTSTFTTLAYPFSSPNREDVSNFVEMDIWFAKSSAVFDDTDDIYTLSNFEKKETGKDADDISLDLRDEDYIWVEVTGNTVFNNTFILYSGGGNYDYIIPVYQEPSSVHFNILDSNMANAFGAGYQGDSNFTVVMDCSHDTRTPVTDLHYGVGWDLSATDFADLALKQQKIYWDEMYWRAEAMYLDPSLDTCDHTYIEGLEKYTNYFAIQIKYNVSVSTVDGNAAEVNCTIAKGENVRAVITGEYIYLIITEIVDFEDGVYDFKFECAHAVNISVSTVKEGRLTVPNDTPDVFTAGNAIGA